MGCGHAAPREKRPLKTDDQKSRAELIAELDELRGQLAARNASGEATELAVSGESARTQQMQENLRSMIDKQLNMNSMDDMQDNFTVTQVDETYIVKVSYERELNLIYEKKPIKYEKSLTLK